MDTNTVIEMLGGTGGAAKLCGTGRAAVRHWRVTGVPPKHWKAIHKATGIAYEALAATKGQPRASKVEHISEPVSRVMERIRKR